MKIYIIKKYINAKNLQHAIKLDKTTKVEECYLYNDFALEESDNRKLGF